jgi:hypothetical protein
MRRIGMDYRKEHPAFAAGGVEVDRLADTEFRYPGGTRLSGTRRFHGEFVDADGAIYGPGLAILADDDDRFSVRSRYLGNEHRDFLRLAAASARKPGSVSISTMQQNQSARASLVRPNGRTALQLL